MESPSATSTEPRPVLPPEPRQRWRLTVRRGPDAPPLPQRELAAAWDATIVTSGLPVVVGDPAKPKPKVVFGAPLTVGMVSEGELLEIVLTERLPAWQVREALLPCLPDGWTLVDLADVWLGGPALVGRVVAADYRVTLEAQESATGTPGPAGRTGPTAADVATAARTLLAARSLPRERAKGDGTVRYDLRPLLADIAVTDPGPPVTVRIRTRFHAELGTGRPDEVVLALGDTLGTPLGIGSIVRERLVLVDDPGLLGPDAP